MNEDSHLDPATEQNIRRHLLGASEADPQWDDEVVELVETELIDQYVRGELSGEELQQFESIYLARAGNRRKVDVAAALQHCLTPRRRPWLLLGSAIGLAATVAVAMVAYWQYSAVTLYPGATRKVGADYPKLNRVLPRLVRLALVDPVPAGEARVVLRNPQKEIWNTTVEIAPRSEYANFILPTWRVPKGSYSIELRVGPNHQSRTAASYLIAID